MGKKIRRYAVFLILSVVLAIGDLAFAENIDVDERYENSWRFDDGQLCITENSKTDNSITLYSTDVPWSKVDGGFINDIGNIISGATKKGIDVSSHQGIIDWNEVKNTDVDYAIIRCGYGDNYTQYDDYQWYNNANGCTDAGIPFGVYIYSYAASIAEAKSEAEHVLRLIEGYELEYPIYLDMEDDDLSVLSNEMLGDIAETFCDIIQSAGYKVGIYANKYWWTSKLTDPVFDNSSWYRWVAQYNSTCTYTGDYTMWQATSTGRVNGINGNVDINFWFGQTPDEDDLSGVDYSFPNTHINTGNYREDIVGIAHTQIGYTELSSAVGTPVIDSSIPYYTKYGDRYGNPNGHWCAFFVLWCAEQAGIPTSIICKSASCGNCGYFVDWFKSNNRWRNNTYIPEKGDIVFFDWDSNGGADHVGIVKDSTTNVLYTIEGNTGGINGYAVMERSRTDGILGYGVPNYELKNKLNGYALSQSKAYVLPDKNSSTVWEIWKGDELQVLCRDGDYYLVMYPYVYTGKFVSAYVPVASVEVIGDIPDADTYYDIMVSGHVKNETIVYHNPSTDALMGSTDNKVRAILNADDTVNVLFETDGFLFIRTETFTGFIEKNSICYETDNSLQGDLNNDSKIDSADAGMILRYDIGILSLSEEQLLRADINSDSKVDSADAGMILRYDIGLIDIF